jgi:hypothetical protein
MIRFIRIGDQISEGHDDFAFWDTVRDCFIDFGGDTVFDSVVDFEEAVSCLTGFEHDSLPRDCVERCRGFIANAVPPLRRTDPDVGA